MPEARPNPAAEMLSLLGAANPLSAISKTVEQFRTSVDSMLRAVSAFTETMEALSGAANRVNRLLDDIEEPVRAVVPRVTAAVKVTEGMIDQLLEPVERVSPLLTGVAESLSSPSIRRLPTQLGEFLELIGTLTTRLSPLSQMLESAGGLFTLSPWRNMLGIAGQDTGASVAATPAPSEGATTGPGMGSSTVVPPPPAVLSAAPTRPAEAQRLATRGGTSAPVASRSGPVRPPSSPVAPTRSPAARKAAASRTTTAAAPHAPAKKPPTKKAAPAKKTTTTAKKAGPAKRSTTKQPAVKTAAKRSGESATAPRRAAR